MKKFKIITSIGLGILIIFLLFTNPSVNNFKKEFFLYMPPPVIDTDFSRSKYIDPHYIVRRDRNYFICSHFTWLNLQVLGIAGNYFIVGVLPGKHQLISQGGQVVVDTFVQDSLKK